VPIALGIDLGTTNSVAAVATPIGVEFVLGPKGERVHPSVVAYPGGGGVLVGHDARMQRLVEPANVIFSAKRLIGQNIRWPMVQLALTNLPFVVEEGSNQQPIVVIHDRRMTIPEISAQVLVHLKRCAERQLGDRVTQAVITVPANFTDAQRQATKEAGRLAGLDVLRLINEPTAAALAYGFGQNKDEIVAVFDLGGGTFDISLLQIKNEVFEVRATDGDFFLGGDDLDRMLAEHLAAELNRASGVDPRGSPTLMMRLVMAAEAIKCHLSEEHAAEGEVEELDLPNGRRFRLAFRISRRQFEGMIAGFVERTIELCRHVLTTTGIEPGAVAQVLCVGGSSRIPIVRQRLAELFQREPEVRINPDEVVAQGAAIQAGSLSNNLIAGTGMASRDAVATSALSPLMAKGSESGITGRTPTKPPLGAGTDSIPRPILLDVNPASLGVQTAGGYTERLLDKNAPIPIERTRTFSTAHDHQTRVVIDCCRGEARKYTENEPLGQLVLDPVPARPRGLVKIDVTFRVDTDGILHVRAHDADTGAAQDAMLSVLGAPDKQSTKGAKR
jgi:molecular chaperone DnaK